MWSDDGGATVAAHSGNWRALYLLGSQEYLGAFESNQPQATFALLFR